MTLTPSDIEQKTFSTALRGYNLDEVDDFLDEVVRSMRKLHEELDLARAEFEEKPAEPEAVAAVETAPVVTPVVEAPPQAPIDESAVGKALIAAQETAERIVTDARSEADEILVRARSEAETFAESRLRRKAEAEQDISRIDSLVERVKSELADLSTAVGADLDEMTRTIETAVSELDAAPANGDDVEEDTDDAAPPIPSDDENVVASDVADTDEPGGDEPGDDAGEDDDEDSRHDNRDESEDDSEDDSKDDSKDDYFNFPDGGDDDDDNGDDRTSG